MVYLDHASATPVDPRVLAFAGRFLSEEFGNPSTLYTLGLSARQALEEARARVAALVGAEKPASIVFTGSATESNNLAIRGTALRNRKDGKKLLVSAIEHISVLNPMKDLQKQGFDLGVIPVDPAGIVDLGALEEQISPETVLVSVNYANDEIGTIEPIAKIARIVHEKGRYLHVNATAAAGRVPIDVERDGIDLLTLSSNDLGGPRGAAALYIRPGVKVQAVMPGGGQERGLRSGTENLFAIAGMGEAARLSADEMEAEMARERSIRDGLVREILTIDDSYLIGHPEQRLPGHASFRFSRIEGESILLNLDTFFGIQVATGSACSSRTLEPSHVLLAIGLEHAEAHGSVVMTLGRSNVPEDVPYVADAMKRTVERLRAISPL
ncbi:aminotransferase class V [Methanofollis liminatans DSM 4140]|uniref:Aminotransferase class V n=1 Tax=Methanofollis liminatans DSM 4140 TaxID=28892 RepID=J0S9N7_9EURY|nr:cysteine desulfurase family protein [Methanofollis liminatans]EJG07344.1 aminotransferase class V [Methanofollis liminatans DSM 4140]